MKPIGYIIQVIILFAVFISGYVGGKKDERRKWERKYSIQKEVYRETIAMIDKGSIDSYKKMFDNLNERMKSLIKENIELHRQFAEKEDIGAGGTTD